MKELLVAGFAVAALAGLAPVAGAAVQATHTTEGGNKHSKTVTRAQVTQKVQQHFAKVDSNRDGIITKAEAEAATHTGRAKLHERTEQRGAAIFDRLDANKDGIVTRAEAEPIFASGRIDIAHAGPGDAKPRHDWDALVSRHDANKDGAVSRAEFEAGRAHHAQRIAKRRQAAGARHSGLSGHMFDMADGNKDGRVTLAEASAAATAHFDAADTNRDGILSPAEMRQARMAMKAKSSR